MSESNSRQDASIPLARRAQCIAEIARHYQPLVPGEAYALDVFKPEDAPGIARLYYGAYGEHFPIDYVYDPAAIIARNANGDVRHLVARTAVGDVVGVGALFYSAPTKVMMEMGALIVDPAYQGRRLVLKLFEIAGEDMPRDVGLKAVLSQAVCDRLIGARLFNRADKIVLACVSVGVLIGGFLTLALMRSAWEIYLAAALIGLGMGVAVPMLNALMFSISRPEYRGLNTNLMMTTLQAGYFFGPIIGASVIALFSYTDVFLGGALLNLVVILVLLALRRAIGKPDLSQTALGKAETTRTTRQIAEGLSSRE